MKLISICPILLPPPWNCPDCVDLLWGKHLCFFKEVASLQQHPELWSTMSWCWFCRYWSSCDEAFDQSPVLSEDSMCVTGINHVSVSINDSNVWNNGINYVYFCTDQNLSVAQCSVACLVTFRVVFTFFDRIVTDLNHCSAGRRLVFIQSCWAAKHVAANILAPV